MLLDDAWGEAGALSERGTPKCRTRARSGEALPIPPQHAGLEDPAGIVRYGLNMPRDHSHALLRGSGGGSG